MQQPFQFQPGNGTLHHLQKTHVFEAIGILPLGWSYILEDPTYSV